MEFLFLIVTLLIAVPILGHYIANVFTKNTPPLYYAFGHLEEFCYRASGIHSQEEMTWTTYGKALLAFNLMGFTFLFLLLLMQGYLPLNPQAFPGLPWALAFNTAVSFVTNTNWQAYAGETTLSYLSQMVGLTVQNFLSAATGLAVFLALSRGLARKNMATIGNFWSDLVRSVVYLFLPLCIVFALLLVSQGVIQNFSPYVEVTTLENATQTIPMGPVASQIAIKQLGSNGGGFFNANGAHPFENPTPFSNFLETFAILLIPAALLYAYGLLVHSQKHAWLLIGVVTFLWMLGTGIAMYAEHASNPIFNNYPLLEGKEIRFGVDNSLVWATSTTATANGSVNTSLTSLSPLAGGIALVNIMVGEVLFGGVGVGVCGLIIFTMLTVFLSGLMVGRTPEYLGKKIEVREMLWVVMAILLPGALVLIGAGISCALPVALTSLGHAGPHGLTEILYAFSSAAGNNGSAFASLDANTNYYNIILGFVMIVGRISIVLPSLALAGLLVKKRVTPPSLATFSTQSLMFAFLLGAVILIMGALTYFPVLCLGPIVEQLLMKQGQTF